MMKYIAFLVNSIAVWSITMYITVETVNSPKLWGAGILAGVLSGFYTLCLYWVADPF